jgi:uncharacterized membrane protein YqgA involved in biofilm formation
MHRMRLGTHNVVKTFIDIHYPLLIINQFFTGVSVGDLLALEQKKQCFVKEISASADNIYKRASNNDLLIKSLFSSVLFNHHYVLRLDG